MSKMTEDLKKWIRRFRSGRIWLNKLRSEATITQYLPLLKRYCDLTGKTPDELIELKMEGMRKVGTLEEFLAEELHDSTINGVDSTESAKSNMSTSVQSFYKHNKRPLVEIRKFERPEAKKRRPTLGDIEDMVNNVQWKRDKALFWFIASAPFRKETVEKLVWGDLEETNNVKIPISMEIEAKRLKGKGRGRYKGLKQICFLHAYAYNKLLAYRKELIRKMTKKYGSFEVTKDTPIFLSYKNGNGSETPQRMSKERIGEVFETASLNAWGNLEEKRFSPHDMRDFLDNALKKAKVVEVDRAPIMGHKIKGVERHYQDPSHKDLMASFESALPYLSPEPQLAKASKATVTAKEELMGLKVEANQRIQIMIVTAKEEITRYEAQIRHWKGMIEIAEKSRKLEPQKDKEYGKLIESLRKQILSAREQISMLRDSRKRLEKML